MKKVALGIIALMFYSCSINTAREIDLEKIDFNYRDDSYIFFRNIRQSNYKIEVLEQAGWRIYRHEDYIQDTISAHFKTALVVNWRVNKAYPVIDIPETVEKEGLQINWVDPESNQSGKLILEGLRRHDEMKLLTQVYNQIIKERELSWAPKGENSPLFSDLEQKEAFRVSMYDFYRLTGIL